jgi:hypothetical protein
MLLAFRAIRLDIYFASRLDTPKALGALKHAFTPRVRAVSMGSGSTTDRLLWAPGLRFAGSSPGRPKTPTPDNEPGARRAPGTIEGTRKLKFWFILIHVKKRGNHQMKMQKNPHKNPSSPKRSRRWKKSFIRR